MSVRKRKPFELGRYIGPLSSERIHKLEAIKQQLLELENRLKMEMVGLREISGNPIDLNETFEDLIPKTSDPSLLEMDSPNIVRSSPLTSKALSSPSYPDCPNEIPQGILSRRTFLVSEYPLTSASPNSQYAAVHNPNQQQPANMTVAPKETNVPTLDFSNNLPRTPGLHGSLEPDAFLAFAADLLALPSKTTCQTEKPSTSNRTLPISRSPSLDQLSHRKTRSRSALILGPAPASLVASGEQTSSASDSDSPPVKIPPRPRVFPLWNAPAILILCLIFISLCYLIICTPTLCASSTSVDTHMESLKEAFPAQNNRLWIVVTSALSTANLWARGADERGPFVVLFLPTVPHDAFHRFLEGIVGALNALSCGQHCETIDLFSPSSNSSSQMMKRNLYDQLKQAHSNGSRCILVRDIDRLPGDAAVVLHGFGDPLNSPLRNTLLLLTVSRLPNIQPEDTHREMETRLRHYLHSLWDSELGRDEVYALVSRLTPRIGIFDV